MSENIIFITDAKSNKYLYYMKTYAALKQLFLLRQGSGVEWMTVGLYPIWVTLKCKFFHERFHPFNNAKKKNMLRK